MRKDLLKSLREGEHLAFSEQIGMIVQLSVPAVMAQMSSIVMQYIDASMVGRLGAENSASVGLMSTSTWLFFGLCSAIVTGFTIQAAQKIGAGKEERARSLVVQGFVVSILFSTVLMAVGVSISGKLPYWLGGTQQICAGATKYFRIYMIFLPALQANYLASGFLQASGNMKLPSILQILMCGLDVVFNALLIFPTWELYAGGLHITVPGAGLGVTGASLGTALAETVVAVPMVYYLLFRSRILHLRKSEKIQFRKDEIKRAFWLGLPVGFEQVVMSGAQIVATRIVSPLGTVAIAANSFSVTAESLCYMPGYGIGTAAATLIGQSTGAGRKDMTRRLSRICVLFGMFVMALSGTLMYIFAPQMIGILTPVEEIQMLGVEVLRIECFAEPMFAAAIVTSGVFRGEGDTMIPSCINFGSMWLVRLPLAAILSPRFGLRGVWIGMCIELCVRGALYLLRLGLKEKKKGR